MTQNTNQNHNVLLDYLVSQAAIQKDWFGFLQQRIAGVDLAYRIAATHADKLSSFMSYFAIYFNFFPPPQPALFHPPGVVTFSWKHYSYTHTTKRIV